MAAVTRAAVVFKEPEILKRRGDRRLLRPVWVATQGLEFEFKSFQRFQKRSNINPALSPNATDAFGNNTYSSAASTR